MRVLVQNIFDNPAPNVITDPQSRAALMTLVLLDCNDQEQLYLDEITKAEAGETIRDLYNQLVDIQLYPDGRALVEELRPRDDSRPDGRRQSVELTLTELKALIHGWLAAKKQFYAEQHAKRQKDEG